jgi:hypothetical protein
MPKKRYTAEEIIHKLREAEVWLSQGKSIDRPALTGPGLGLVYAASWFIGNSSPGTVISGAGGAGGSSLALHEAVCQLKRPAPGSLHSSCSGLVSGLAQECGNPTRTLNGDEAGNDHEMQ